jgi:hypothetical protein
MSTKQVIAEIDCVPALQPVSNPRNTKQVASIQANERKKLRLTHDALYNIHALVDGFIARVLMCGSAHELGQLLLCRSPSAPQLLSYDTTFQLGDFFVSPLLFSHTAFISSPVIPLLFLPAAFPAGHGLHYGYRWENPHPQGTQPTICPCTCAQSPTR